MRRPALLAGLLLVAACSNEPDSDIPPLPKESAETANQLMAEAERAAGNAATRAGEAVENGADRAAGEVREETRDNPPRQ